MDLKSFGSLFDTYRLEGVTLQTLCGHHKLLQQPAGGDLRFHCCRRRRGSEVRLSVEISNHHFPSSPCCCGLKACWYLKSSRHSAKLLQKLCNTTKHKSTRFRPGFSDWTTANTDNNTAGCRDDVDGEDARMNTCWSTDGWQAWSLVDLRRTWWAELTDCSRLCDRPDSDHVLLFVRMSHQFTDAFSKICTSRCYCRNHSTETRTSWTWSCCRQLLASGSLLMVYVLILMPTAQTGLDRIDMCGWLTWTDSSGHPVFELWDVPFKS